MFHWVLRNAYEYYDNFIYGRFPIKANDFYNFFSTINFSYHYLPEA